MKRIKIRRQEQDKEQSIGDVQLQAWLADSYLSRLRGLLGKKQLGDDDGLLLKRCSSVHTIGMRYPLDLVFMDRKGRVLKCEEGVKPFRTAAAKGAYYTLELNEGVVSKKGISVNDQFCWDTI